ncbi:MAG TPA: response regulator [Bryobacteraceae bacterium]|nr:response regulator [Bryobacteraceae bacterium]
MKTLIVDDEPIARRVLREELELLPDVAVVGEAADGHEALQQIAKLKPDLVFLDLQMPVIGGFEVVRRLEGRSLPVVVIVTAFDQHAIQAFEAGAIDYLLKPIRRERLEKAVERARKLRSRPRAVAENIARIASAPDEGQASLGRRIVGKSGAEYFLLDPKDVLAFQAEGELVWIVTAKHRFLAAQSLRTVEARLEKSQFQRVHRNAIVNVNHVRKMSPMTSQRWLLTLTNQQELIVSKRQAHNIRSILQW